MVRVEGVRRSYPELEVAVDFAVGRGELVSVLGPSGSGKTTTLRLIAGFERPEEGRIVVDGREVTGLPPEKRRVGFVFQDYTLFPHMDVGHNVGYALRVRGASGKEEAEAVSRYLGLVGLGGFESREVQTLSGGEQQRVAIARALASAPLLLLLDEPFSSIDTMLRRELRRQMLELQKELGITLLFVTHNQEEALAISDRVIVMGQGRIAQIGTPEELYGRPVSRFVASFVGEASFLDGTLGGPAPGAGAIARVQGLRVFEALAAASPTTPGQEVSVVVRPSRLRFLAPGAEGPNSFAVRIAEREFYGHYHEYVCAADAAPAARVVVYDAERRVVGERAVVSFRPEEAVIVPRER